MQRESIPGLPWQAYVRLMFIAVTVAWWAGWGVPRLMRVGLRLLGG